ncbi:MAG TPA: GNAT family N-acetyltransferase [Ktedonobacterales bacterium]|nr:GNAT family N-acetyltransferase [Ktedonobacterales bacterium]
MPFYPPGAAVPAELRTDELLLRPLRASDDVLDYAAVMASRERLLRRSAGQWPRAGFTLAENRADLAQHEAEHQARAAFTYTVMNRDETECLGCLYIYPLRRTLARYGAPAAVSAAAAEDEAEASFWVRQDRESDDLDRRLLAALLPWLHGEFACARLWLRAFAAEERQVAVLRAAGLRQAAEIATSASPLLLFDW